MAELRQADVELGKDMKVPEVCKQLGISEQTYYRWRQKYGGMDPQMAKQLREMEKENARLKKLVADQALDIQILKEAAQPVYNPANGHYYEIVWSPSQLDWNTAQAAVQGMTLDGTSGHLATITSESENNFIAQLMATQGPNTHQVSWVGGQKVGGTWRWDNGDPWGYENFNPLGQNSGTDLQVWWLPQSSPTYGTEHGTWNAQVAGNVAGSRTYVVEYDTPLGQPIYNPVNGHYYELVIPSTGLSWQDAKQAAAAMSHRGFKGHLATITDVTENNFITNSLLVPDGYSGGYWLGGEQNTASPTYSEPRGGWQWITGESWSYENWRSGEPNNNTSNTGSEEFLTINSAPHNVGTWDDYDYRGPYIVEYEFSEYTVDPPNAQPQPTLSVLPGPSAASRKLVLITHGWDDSVHKDDESKEWVKAVGSAIAADIAGTPEVSLPPTDVSDHVKWSVGEWDIVGLDWSGQAATDIPTVAKRSAEEIGAYIGNDLHLTDYDSIHMIAHSAGSWLIDQATDTLRLLDGSVGRDRRTVQSTFLDAYVPLFDVRSEALGDNADWAEQFVDSSFDLDPSLLRVSLGATNRNLRNAFNVDVTDLDEDSGPFDVVGNHGWPIYWYLETILNDNGENQGWGYARSLTRLGDVGNFPPAGFAKGDRLDLGDGIYTLPEDGTLTIGDPISLADAPSVTSTTGTATVNEDGALSMTTGSPVWFSTLIETTEQSNFIALDVAFLSNEGAEGMLSIYWENELLGVLDERVSAESEVLIFGLPGTFPAGFYSVAFRLDPYTDTASSTLISNVRTGYAAVPEPASFALIGFGALMVARRRH